MLNIYNRLNIAKYAFQPQFLLKNCCRIVPLQALCSYTTSKIEIPARIPRGPTDILRVLDATVGRDPTAAHYKYHDDPFLIPNSNSSKRTFTMAQEAGRKAAHWIRAQHPDLFQHREADPFIEAFAPPMVYTESSEVKLDDLSNLLAIGQVSDAILVYKLLKKNKIEVDFDTELGLLELVCYYNSEDGVSDEFIEEKWFRQSKRTKERARKTWKDNGIAEEIFTGLPQKNDRAYAAIIQGMVKYYQADRAWALFEEAQQNQIQLSTNTFNALIEIANFLKEDAKLRWELTSNLINQMKNSNLKPNLGTLNAILFTMSTIGNTEMGKQIALKALAEFKGLGIEPSLASWHFVVKTFCKDRGPQSTVLSDIMDVLENKEFEIHDVRDINFFASAMDTCRYHLNDIGLAKRVNDLLHFGNNYNLIGDSYKESIYFRNYFALFCNNIPIEEFMSEIYNVLVPHIYTPEPGVMVEVLQQISTNAAVQYIPKIWSDLVMFEHHHRENLVVLLINAMADNLALLDEELREKFAIIAWDMYNRLNQQDDMRPTTTLTGDLLGKLMTLLSNGGKFNQACVILDALIKNQNSIAGVPNFDDLSLFLDNCIEQKLPSKAINCLEYSADCGFEDTKLLAQKLRDNLTLDGEHLTRITRAVGRF